MKKILIIRFSSIGDIVLTTPVLRCIKQQLKGVELHYVTKEQFGSILAQNPYVDKLHTFKKDVSELFASLKAENYDLVLDLHKNLRSLRLRQKLGAKSVAFNKLNVRKFLAVRFKAVGALPPVHIVERYLETVKHLGVVNDGKGLDHFIAEKDNVDVGKAFFNGAAPPYIALVAGGSYYTKKIPIEKLREICLLAKHPVVILGSAADKPEADILQKEFLSLHNACGLFNLGQSASIIRQAEWVITSDTGLMHIASAFQKKIISVWGNTIPEFGMAPYLPHPQSQILEVKGLSCRPCSKLGYKKCPEGHFKCMREIDLPVVKDL